MLYSRTIGNLCFAGFMAPFTALVLLGRVRADATHCIVFSCIVFVFSCIVFSCIVFSVVAFLSGAHCVCALRVEASLVRTACVHCVCALRVCTVLRVCITRQGPVPVAVRAGSGQ